MNEQATNEADELPTLTDDDLNAVSGPPTPSGSLPPSHTFHEDAGADGADDGADDDALEAVEAEVGTTASGSAAKSRSPSESSASAELRAVHDLSAQLSVRQCRNCHRTASALTALSPPRRLRRCLQCRSISYCSRACQAADWPRHRAACRQTGKQLQRQSRLVSDPDYQMFGQPTRAGTLLVTGSGMFGQQANGSEVDNVVFTTVRALESVRVTQVALGTSHTVVATSNGQLYTWGDGDSGQLAQPGTVDSDPVMEPRRVGSLEAKVVKRVAAGLGHSAVVDNKGSLLTFGRNALGQLGLNEASRALAALPPGEKRWDFEDKPSPKLCRALRDVVVVSVACGDEHTIVLSQNGLVFGFGNNAHGAVGVPDRDRAIGFPVLLPGLSTVPTGQIACGARHSMSLSASGTVYTWGRGATGHGSHELTIPRPSALKDFARRTRVVQIQAAGDVSACLTDQGRVYTWGHNAHGQLGLGSTETRVAPTLIEPRHFGRSETPTPVRQIACGANHMLALTVDNELYTWGHGAFGQLGLGSDRTSFSIPQRVDPSSFVFLDGGAGIATEASSAPSTGTEDSDGGGSSSGAGELLMTWVPVSIECGQDTSAIIVQKRPVTAARASARMERNNRSLRIISRVAPASSFRYNTFVSLLREYQLNGGKDAQAWRPLVKYVSTCFSSCASLNGSFFDADFGVNAVLVEHVYKLIFSTQIPQMHRAVMAGSQAALEHTSRVVSMEVPDPVSLRAVLIVLQNPLLGITSDAQTSLLLDVCYIMQLTGKEATTQVLRWLSRYPRDIFSVRLVNMVVRHINYLGARLQRSRTVPAPIQHLIAFLSLLYEANSMASPPLVSRDAFYLEGLADRFDLAQDYVTWNRFESVRARLAAQAPPFSLCKHSFVMPPHVKAQILQIEHAIQLSTSAMMNMFRLPLLHLVVRRQHLVEDTLNQMTGLSVGELRARLVIQFDGEEGLDAGGLTAEYFELISAELVNPERYSLFSYNADERVYFYNRDADTEDPDVLKLYHLTGILLGFACFLGRNMHVNFPPVFFKHLLDMAPTLDDLESTDAVVAASLRQLLDYEGDDVEDVFCLTFSAQVSPTKQVDLVEGGSEIPVTSSNRREFVDLYVRHLLVDSVRVAQERLVAGFRLVCDGLALRKLGFTPAEMSDIICGQPKLDFEALKAKARYEGGYHPDHPTVQAFWDIVLNELDEQQQRDLLVFFSGSARSPAGGLGALRPLVIQRASGDTDMLPTTHVCFHTLLLPEYASKEKLRAKLLLAIAHHEGFGMQ